MACKNCVYYDPNETWNGKGYCTWYKKYYYPDENGTCSRFSTSNSTGCYLTTCCCEYYGKKDGCYELQTMRRFRDDYLALQPGGKEIIDRYYANAPEIVKKIKDDAEYPLICEDIYLKIIKCCEMVEKGDNDGCINTYLEMVEQYEKKYLN